MYIQIKKSGKYKYIYIIEAYRRSDGKVGHRTIEKLGRYEDCIKKDPDFVQKLKDNLKIRSHFFSANSDILDTINNKEAYNPNSLLSKKGYPVYNYGSVLLKYIYKNVLYLDYCFKYLQSQYTKKLDFDVSQIIFNRILTKIFFKNICHINNSYYFLNNVFTLESIYDHNAELKLFLEKQKVKVLKFFINKISIKANIPAISEFLVQINKEDVEYVETLQKDSLDNIVPLKDLKANINKISVDSFLNLFESITIKAMFECIRQKVGLDIKDVSDKNISNILNDCLLSLFIPQTTNSKIMYLKVSNNNVENCDLILKAFNFSPLINYSIKSDLARALKMKYCLDKNLLGDEIYNRFVLKEDNDVTK